ncbi:hypothetical protein [Sporosarcina sp. P20a]|uniref:hypothetical protein n=1 Tax=Sporosarcina sp. P20a TaxID=2048256 RepID=UPI001179BBAF|nr:hypothetical protein [Sporosarcina sp. P20a]
MISLFFLWWKDYSDLFEGLVALEAATLVDDSQKMLGVVFIETTFNKNDSEDMTATPIDLLGFSAAQQAMQF